MQYYIRSAKFINLKILLNIDYHAEYLQNVISVQHYSLNQFKAIKITCPRSGGNIPTSTYIPLKNSDIGQNKIIS